MVSDLPAYANLSGWSTKGKLACPSYHKETKSIRLPNSHKESFMAHHRWLELLHAFRLLKDAFDGTEEHEGLPRFLTGEEVLAELKGFRIKFGKLVKDNPSLPYNWKKRNGKTKDHLNGRRDLEEIGIRYELHPEPLPNVPDGYAANISRFIQVKHPNISGLKSHDNHILMQQLLPVAIRNILPKHMEKDIGKILCELERIFPPSFFDLMIHLSVHLASKARLGGPVHYCWMYLIERYLGTLKSYVRNYSKPEGSIAEGHLVEECLSFCSLYLASDVETIHNKTSRYHDDGGDETVLPIFCMSGRPIGATNIERLGYDTLSIAHSYVLFNCSEIVSYEYEEKNRTTQNSRVMLKAITSRFSSARDNNPVLGHVTYYGVLNDIIELQYADDKKVVLFHYDWILGGSRIKVDENGFTTLDFRETHLQSDTLMGPQIIENATIELVRDDLDGTIVDDDTLVAATDKNQIDDAS
ncbi:uncharacterized protein [Rutidosis leptorrhynchoides]|uniref:uncharacterized protein n=1 Tax=Rutidosis leptorrhynchoides TaxID=125765 RepID=UPI003A992C95